MANFGASNRISVLGIDHFDAGIGLKNKKNLGVYLDSQPATPPHIKAKDAFGNTVTSSIEVVFHSVRPILLVLKAMAMLPMTRTAPGKFSLVAASASMVYSVCMFAALIVYIVYIQWDKVEIFRSSEGKFEEAAIDYLFVTYLIPIIAIPIMWYETTNISSCFTLWSDFERMYRRVNMKMLTLDMGNKTLFITIGVPVIASGSMVVIHMTMVQYKILQIIPYCFINTVTYIIGGYWYIMCSVIATVAWNVANDFQRALKNIGPSTKVAEYRSLWLRLTKITRDTGVSLCYTMIFLCLYLFMTVTLSIYGLLSQIQAGFGLKDIGLAITASFSIALLFFICDVGHYASMNVRDNFQKKLLLVELSWMNDDAQQEISMFLRATEMNSTDLSLGGFFDVNRNLFKGLMATMVTYLVVLLQFQISIPSDTGDESDNTTLGLSSTDMPTTTKS